MNDSLHGVDSNMWVALSTALLVLVTWLLARVARSQSVATSLLVQSELLREFDTDAVRQVRKKIAQGREPVSREEQLDVLDAIEHIATAVRRGALDLRTIWASSLGDLIFFHIEQGRTFMMKERSSDRTLFEDSLWYRRRAGLLTWRRKFTSILLAPLRFPFDHRPSRHRAALESAQNAEADLKVSSERQR